MTKQTTPDKSTLALTFDKLPVRENTKEEKEFINKHLDVSKKIVFMTNVVTYDDGSSLMFKFDTALLRKCKDDIRFCAAIKGAISWKSPDDIKKYMLEYIKNDFDPSVKEVHIFGKGRFDEKDICIVMNPKTDEQILWIKFLREEITDVIWNELKESQAGKDTVIINQSLGREDTESS